MQSFHELELNAREQIRLQRKTTPGETLGNWQKLPDKKPGCASTRASGEGGGEEMYKDGWGVTGKVSQRKAAGGTQCG